MVFGGQYVCNYIETSFPVVADTVTWPVLSLAQLEWSLLCPQPIVLIVLLSAEWCG